MNLVIYIHGKGGNAAEAEHYQYLFPNDTVIGFDYQSDSPWEAQTEFSEYFNLISGGFERIYLIANSIGAYFSLCSLAEKRIAKAYFISPIVDMERLICDMMMWANVTEGELEEKREISTVFGDTLSWEYLQWVRTHPIRWKIPTAILYGGKDNLQSPDTITAFADTFGASVTVMENGEHWFHTEEQMAFLDDWIKKDAGERI